jgi:hypothetical protein
LTPISLDSMCISPRTSRPRAGWVLSALSLALSLACSVDDPSEAASDLFEGSAGRGGSGGSGASAASGAPVPAGAGSATAANGVDGPASTEGANPGDLANVEQEAPVDDGAAEAAADAGSSGVPTDVEVGEAAADAGIDPSLDENVVFIQQDGFQTTYFAVDCRSLGADGSVIEGVDPLPVGGGSVLECVTGAIGALATQDFLSSTDERWCALGAIDTATPSGDPRLLVEIADAPDDAPWTLLGTVEGEPIELGTVSVFGATAWPLWVETHYAVIEVAPNPTGQLCDLAFGL